MNDICKICGDEFDENDKRSIVKMKLESAIYNINDCAHLRGKNWSGSIQNGDQLHEDCSKRFVNLNSIIPVASSEDDPKCRKTTTRSVSLGACIIKKLIIAPAACSVVKRFV